MNPAVDEDPEGGGSLELGATVDEAHWAMPFTDIKPHARGGLGEVFRATDPELHRTVAVKCLQSRHAENPGSVQRFLLEAEVTARLEHPGVVPVYGFYAGGGRPAYAMRFIEGKTFAEEITLYHAGAADPVSFRRLLQSFLQVCQTVAYAHSRGVIHRDLKPANVMLGKFGETLVVDWGLAKVVGRPEAVQAAGVGETLVPLSGASVTGETEMGSAVGTPAYMSPEQAVGRWDVVAQASDIYGLGAVLYTLLTGRAPLEKGNWPEMNQKIQRGEITLPRLVKPSVSRALEAICLKAMAVDREKRYASAEHLAADIEHWMADEPVTAAPDSFTRSTLRWMKHHRTLVSGLGALLVAAVVGLSIGTVLLQAARVETEKQRLEAVAARGNAESLNHFLVEGILKQANPRNNPVGDKLTVRQLLDQASDELLAQSKLNVQPTVEVVLHEVVGQAYEYLDASERAEKHFRRAVQLRTTLFGPESPQTLAMANRLILSIINLGRLSEAEPLATAAYRNCLRELGKEHRETAEAMNNLAELRALQRDFEAAIPMRREAVKVMIARGGREDNKTLEFENNLATTLVLAGEPEEAVSILRSVADRRLVLHPRDPETATTLANLGGALIALNRFADASSVLQNAVSLQENSRGEQSDAALDARNLYGYALEGEEKWKEAEVAFQAVLAQREKSANEATHNPAGLERTYAHLSRLNAKQKNWKREAEFLIKLLQSRRPDPSRSLDTFSSSLADIVSGAAEGESASALLKECMETIKERTWPADWLGIEFKSLYGESLRRQGKMDAAEPVLLEAAAELQKAIGAPSWGVAAIRKRVADFYDAAEKPAEAAKWR